MIRAFRERNSLYDYVYIMQHRSKNSTIHHQFVERGTYYRAKSNLRIALDYLSCSSGFSHSRSLVSGESKLQGKKSTI